MPNDDEVIVNDRILECFDDFFDECDNPKYTFYVCKGGRNSAKSTTISQRIIFDIIDLPINAIVIRKVGNTLRESVYEQLKEAANLLGVYEEFTFTTNPLQITYRGRGNKIIFRGADDAQKMKSIKTASFPIARCWIEELTEFRSEDELQVIMDSVLRGELPDGITYKFFYSYNPPKRKQHWVNKKYETQFIAPNTYVHHSDYRGNPFLPAQVLEEIENVKRLNERKYKWIYLGEPSGGGIVPFDNLTFRSITDEEASKADNIRQGLDWGYASDPLSFVRLHYDKTRRKLYFLDEFYGVKISNRECAEWIKTKGYNNSPIIADSAEPKSIAEMRDMGIKIQSATKGDGSVEYGEKWLDDLSEIVIDYKRTPNAAREFENIDYEVDKDGKQKPRLDGEDNHSIDATRYACEMDMKSNQFVIPR